MELYTEESLPSSGHVALKNNKNPGHLKEKKLDEHIYFKYYVFFFFKYNT